MKENKVPEMLFILRSRKLIPVRYPMVDGILPINVIQKEV
jgi:hypothetical protein